MQTRVEHQRENLLGKRSRSLLATFSIAFPLKSVLDGDEAWNVILHSCKTVATIFRRLRIIFPTKSKRRLHFRRAVSNGPAASNGLLLKFQQ